VRASRSARLENSVRTVIALAVFDWAPACTLTVTRKYSHSVALGNEATRLPPHHGIFATALSHSVCGWSTG